MNSITKYLYKQSFKINIVSFFANPIFILRKELISGIRSFAPELNGRMLDFGCGNKPYRSLFKTAEYIGVDIKQSGHDPEFLDVDFYYDGKTIPFADSHFDSIFCSEVLEHVFNTDEILAELNRVVKPGGKLLMTVPFCWNEHEVPYDNVRYTSFGITHLLNRHGFEVVRLKKSGNFIQVIFQLKLLYLFETVRKWGIIGFALVFPFIIPVNLLCIIFSAILPRNNSLFFNDIVLAQKKKP